MWCKQKKITSGESGEKKFLLFFFYYYGVFENSKFVACKVFYKEGLFTKTIKF